MDLSLDLSPSPVGVRFTERFTSNKSEPSDPRTSSFHDRPLQQQTSQTRDRGWFIFFCFMFFIIYYLFFMLNYLILNFLSFFFYLVILIDPSDKVSLPEGTRSSSLRYEPNPSLSSSTESIGGGGGDLYSNLRKSLDDEKRNQLERTRVEVLQAENDRLKRELGTFDSEFFDQLEDLKFRYSTLQDIVGEGNNRGIVPLDHVRYSTLRD